MRTRRTSVPAIRTTKASAGGPRLAMMTAYDEPTARMVDAGGVDLILVGDSVGNVVLGHEDTLRVTVDDMVHHTAAVAAARPAALIIGDLPWLSYHVTVEEAVRSAAALVRAGADAVKLEGGVNRLEVIGAIIDAEIPVMGHLGLTPQSVRAFGGFKVQGRSADAADVIRQDAAAYPTASGRRSPSSARSRPSASVRGRPPMVRSLSSTTPWVSAPARRPNSSASTLTARPC